MAFKFEVGQVFNIKRYITTGQPVYYPLEITKVTTKRVYFTFQGKNGYSEIKINNTGDQFSVNYSKGLFITPKDLVNEEPTVIEPELTQSEIIVSTEVLNDDYSDYYDFKVGDRVVLLKNPCNVAGEIIKIENGVYHVSAYGATYQDNGFNLRLLTKNSAYIYDVDFESNDDYSHYKAFKRGDKVLMSSGKVGVILGVEGGIYAIDVDETIYQDDDCNLTLFTENLAAITGIEYKQHTPSNVIQVDFVARKKKA